MSIRVTSDVWSKSHSKGMDKLVLLAIANMINDEFNCCWPSLAMIGNYANCTEDEARNSLQSLIDMGEVKLLSHSEVKINIPPDQGILRVTL